MYLIYEVTWAFYQQSNSIFSILISYRVVAWLAALSARLKTDCKYWMAESTKKLVQKGTTLTSSLSSISASNVCS